MVEVSRGGFDYCNPDALGAKYPGETDEYDSPVEAVDVAISICRAWRKDGEPRARVGVGSTLGMTMPFEPIRFREARRWAKEEIERLPKCARCGQVLPARPYRVLDMDEEYCSEYCAEEAYAEAMEATE